MSGQVRAAHIATPEQRPVTVAGRSSPALASGSLLPYSGKALPQKSVPAPDAVAIAEALNKTTSIGRQLRFQVDPGNGPAVIQVLDRDTGELIRQIPPEKASLAIQQNGGIALNLIDDMV